MSEEMERGLEPLDDREAADIDGGRSLMPPYYGGYETGEPIFVPAALQPRY
jgi:hypothetical protein